MESPTRMRLGSLAQHADPFVASKAALAIKAIDDLPQLLRAELGPDTPLEDCLQRLTVQRSAALNKDPVLSLLDAAIVPLVEIQRGMFGGGPYDIASEPAPPSPTPGQGLLLDLKEVNLHVEVSALLGVDFLSEAVSVQAPQEVKGILWGPGRRPLVCLPAQLRGGKIVNVFLLVDTGAPVTELSPTVFSALGCDNIPAAATINLGGRQPTQVRLCDQGAHGNHKDIPVLGADFLTKNRCLLVVDYSQEEVTIRFQ